MSDFRVTLIFLAAFLAIAVIAYRADGGDGIGTDADRRKVFWIVSAALVLAVGLKVAEL